MAGTNNQTWNDPRKDAVLRHELMSRISPRQTKGLQKGYDMQDWLQAERELSKEKTTTQNVKTSQILDVASDPVQPRLGSPLQMAPSPGLRPPSPKISVLQEMTAID